jgi:hypothetical protein
MKWMDAQTLIAMKMFSTDSLNPLPYVQSMSLASIEDAFVFQNEDSVFVEIDVCLPTHQREKSTMMLQILEVYYTWPDLSLQNKSTNLLTKHLTH